MQTVDRKFPVAGNPAAIADPAERPVRTRAPHSEEDSPQFALKVADLSKSFRSGFLRRRIRGIDGVSFSVERGKVFALLGHNGAGKTTTINCILDLIHADDGEVAIMGRDHRDRRARAGVGYLPERPYFFEHLTGAELMQLYAALLDLPAEGRREHIEDLLRNVGMLDHAGRPLRKYSKGMLQRLGLAQALLGDPELLILDEPMSGLDPVGRRDVRELITSLKKKGKTIILSSHIVPDVELLADAVGVLREGRMVLYRDLSDRGDDYSYNANLALARDDLGTCPLPDWATVSARDGGRGTVWVEAADVGRLRELLDRCHVAGVPVQSVETRRTGLEELFMNAHSGGGNA